MSNWIINAHKNLNNLNQLMKLDLIKSNFIGIDETTLQVVREPGKRPSSDSYMWHLRSGDERPVCYFEYR